MNFSISSIVEYGTSVQFARVACNQKGNLLLEIAAVQEYGLS
jgi:hypothetical protein